MRFARTLLRPVASLAAWHAAQQKRRFLAAHRRTRCVQEALLKELLCQHAETHFGREHGFASLRSYEDFTTAVPISNYETLRPYMEKVFNGQPEALLPPGQPVLMFSLSSGTTGKPKRIPVTPRFLQEMRRGWNIFGLRVLKDHPRAWLRPILPISSPMQESISPTGLPCGAISGLLASTQKPIVQRMYVVPEAVSGIPEPESRYYTTLRCGVGRDVAIITTANPSSTIRLIEVGQKHAERLIRDVADGTVCPPDSLPESLSGRLPFRPNRKLARHMEAGLKRDGQLLPKHFWKIEFLTNWTGGTLGLFLRRLRELFGDVPIRDIGLLASEGRFSIPIQDSTPAGLAEITGNFLEFIPAECAEQSDPPTLRAEQTEIDKEYFLVVTNWAGLWRYHIGDRVRVVDRFGHSPVFEFLSRGQHTANITGEKLTEHQVVEAMQRATGGAIQRFVMQGRFARQPYYELRFEQVDGLDVVRLSEQMDRTLCQLNLEYHSKRRSDRLGPVTAKILPPGTLAQVETEKIRARHGRSEQYKHQYLLTEVLEDPAEKESSRTV